MVHYWCHANDFSRVYQTTEYTKKSIKNIFEHPNLLIIITVLFVSIVNIQDRDKYNYRDLDNEFLIYNLNEVTENLETFIQQIYIYIYGKIT